MQSLSLLFDTSLINYDAKHLCLTHSQYLQVGPLLVDIAVIAVSVIVA
jgi:hypothetical protein